MDRKRVAFIVYVDLDPIPGTFHSKESAQNVIRGLLVGAIERYHPLVSLAPQELQHDDKIDSETNIDYNTYKYLATDFVERERNGLIENFAENEARIAVDYHEPYIDAEMNDLDGTVTG